MARQRRIWVVEMWMDEFDPPRWEPTVGVGLDRDDGRWWLTQWRKKNDGCRFRLTKYQPTDCNTGGEDDA